METPKLPERQKFLVAVPQSVEIVVSDDGDRPLAFVLPPFRDIAEIEGLKKLNFSLREFSAREQKEYRPYFSEEFQRLHEKADKFGTSPILFSRLATLAHFAGNAQKEFELLNLAKKLSNEPFYGHRLGEALIARGEDEEAEHLFSGMNLSEDTGANLRLAYFCIERQDFERAERFVAAALAIDPLDYAVSLFDGALQLIGQQYQRAIQSFRKALRERPSSAVAHCNIAIAYVGLREPMKALSYLKKAVALDPLNNNALALLSDVAFELEKDEEALPSLRYFVQFEQKNASVWSRLARSAFRIGKADESIEALKRQASLDGGGIVWSNLGVAYQRKGETQRAAECYGHAIKLEAEARGRAFFIASRNMIQLYFSREDMLRVAALASDVLKLDETGIVVSDEQISDLISMYVHALYVTNEQVRAEQVAHRYLSDGAITESLALWLVGALASRQALRGSFDELGGLVKLGHSRADHITGRMSAAKENFFNNVAFALAEKGDLAEAEKFFSYISNLVHKSAYPTATWGLMNFRKGRVDKAVELYDEAVRLASSRHDKHRIRQKLNLELGKYYAAINESKARRWLGKVLSEKDGEPELARQASKVVHLLRK